VGEVWGCAAIPGRSSLKQGSVTTPGYLNNERIRLAVTCVRLLDFRAEAPGLNPDNRVGTGIKRFSAVEDINTQ
jgi:hypothetical protein